MLGMLKIHPPYRAEIKSSVPWTCGGTLLIKRCPNNNNISNPNHKRPGKNLTSLTFWTCSTTLNRQQAATLDRSKLHPPNTPRSLKTDSCSSLSSLRLLSRTTWQLYNNLVLMLPCHPLKSCSIQNPWARLRLTLDHHHRRLWPACNHQGATVLAHTK